MRCREAGPLRRGGGGAADGLGEGVSTGARLPGTPRDAVRRSRAAAQSWRGGWGGGGVGREVRCRWAGVGAAGSHWPRGHLRGRGGGEHRAGAGRAGRLVGLVPRASMRLALLRRRCPCRAQRNPRAGRLCALLSTGPLRPGLQG